MFSIGFAKRARFDVQAQLSFARIFVGAMTNETIVGKNGTNIAIELNDFGRRYTCGKDARAQQTSGNGQSDNLFHEQNLTDSDTNKFAREAGYRICFALHPIIMKARTAIITIKTKAAPINVPTLANNCFPTVHCFVTGGGVI